MAGRTNEETAAKRGAAARWVLLVVAFGVPFASPALAQPPPPIPSLTFEWSAPPECPSSADVLAATQRLLGGPQALLSGDRWTVRAVVSHEGVWSVSIETASTSGPHRRTLHAQTCQGLVAATALILALAINPDAVAKAAPAPPRDSSSSLPTAPAEADNPGHVSTSGPAIHFSVGVPVSVSAGVLPSVDYGVGGALATRIDSILLELSFEDWLRPVVATIPSSSAGGTFELVSGTLYACNVFGGGWLELGPCAQLDVGRIEASGLGVTRIDTKSTLWLAAGAGGLGVAKLDARGNWSLPVHLDLLVPLERRDFVLQNVPGVVYHPPYLAGRAAVGLAYRFW